MGERTVKTVKRLCVLQVTPEDPNPEHVELFSEKENCDFFFVTHDKPHSKALEFCPDTTWTDTRNILADKVPKEYDYYAFIDYDYVLNSKTELGPLEQILNDLDKYNPAVLTYYPGKGMTTPFATNEEYFKKFEHSVMPFSHCGMKIIHHSLIKWFYPMITRFGGGVESCHLFNIMEIPFMNNIICSHQMVYDNGNTDEEAPHNLDGGWNKYNMDQMWKWISPSFKKMNILHLFSRDPHNLNDSLFVKQVFWELLRMKKLHPKVSDKDVNYYDLANISKFFNLDHEHFLNLDLGTALISTKPTDSDYEIAKEHLLSLKFSDFLTKQDPWPAIVSQINEKTEEIKFESLECIKIYQDLSNCESHFHRASSKDLRLEEYLKGKRVALVGPAPYLQGKNKGKLIDEHDVVVRIQNGIPSIEDYGSRTDIVQSCLNSNYGPPLVKHLQFLTPEERPKFVICNDTASEIKSNGEWAFVDEVYENTFKQLNIPFVHLGKNDLWERWALYWQIYPKEHIERFGTGQYTVYSANFNSGYGAINVLLSYPIKELSVFGLDFYKTGIPQVDAEKYNTQYTDTYGKSGTHNGPDKVLHDQLSQIMHCKNVLLRDSRLNLDKTVYDLLCSDSLNYRIDRFMKLPKFKKQTR